MSVDADLISVGRRAVQRLVDDLGPDGARQAIRVLCAKFEPLELAALAAHWPTWARPKQMPPPTGWRSFGFLGARGLGKTRSLAEHVNIRVQSGRAGSIGLCAQNEDKSIEIHIEGPTGLIKTAPPWFRPVWEAAKKQLVWQNGARAYVRTPESPGTIRSGEHELSWLSEVQSWPKATREEAFLNFQFATRVGDACTLWDATPKRGDPILLALLHANELEPDRHIVVGGTIDENGANLGKGVVDDLKKKYGGTAQGREELEGEMLKEGENPIAKEAWITRRRLPDAIVRRGLGIDPAVTTRKGSDRTGLVGAALGVDRQAYVHRDMSGKHQPHEWAGLSLDYYVDFACDIIVVETNKGGDLVIANLRAMAAARKPKLNVVEIERSEKPQHQDGVVFIKQVHSRGEKADRARPLSTAYHEGRVSHVIGSDLTSLETTLTTWEPTPGARSPDDLDATNIIVTELLDLTDDAIDFSAGFDGIEQMSRALRAPRGELGSTDLSAMLNALERRGSRKI